MKVKCPNCNKAVSLASDNQYRPFCSERCRLIDLGEWVQEGYSIPDQETGLSEAEIEVLESTIKH